MARRVPDLNRNEFESKLLRRGFRHVETGYWRLPTPHTHIVVCESNGGATLRSRLAFMVRSLQRWDDLLGTAEYGKTDSNPTQGG